jgi:hypothetical protein
LDRARQGRIMKLWLERLRLLIWALVLFGLAEIGIIIWRLAVFMFRKGA